MVEAMADVQGRNMGDEALSRWDKVDAKFKASDLALKELIDRQDHLDAQGEKVKMLEKKLAVQQAEIEPLKEQHSRSALQEAQLVVR